jgi:hypothetical protein
MSLSTSAPRLPPSPSRLLLATLLLLLLLLLTGAGLWFTAADIMADDPAAAAAVAAALAAPCARVPEAGAGAAGAARWRRRTLAQREAFRSCAAAVHAAENLTRPTCSYGGAAGTAAVAALYRAHGPPCRHAASCADTLGYVDVPPAEWARRRAQHAAQQRRQTFDLGACDGPTWFQNNWEPSLACAAAARVGSMGDGGKWVCDPDRLAASRGPCRVYSFGSRGKIDFELGVLRVRPDCEVHTFDPTVAGLPASAAADAAAAGALRHIRFHALGLAAANGVVPIGGACGAACPVRDLPTLLAALGHAAAVVDILKIDIENMEYAALNDLLWSCRFPPNVRMVLVELHAKTPRSFPLDAQRLFLGLAHAGFAIYAKEPNTVGCGGNCIEYAFIRTALCA